MSDPFKIDVPELKKVQVCYEEVQGGLQWEQVYVVTDEDYTHETESFIGWILEGDVVPRFSGPYQFVFDGLLYPCRITPEKVKEIIGENAYKFHEGRMKAVSSLMLDWNTFKAFYRELDEDEEPEPYREDQRCQGFNCGAAPLGCSDPNYCPRRKEVYG